MCCNFPAEEKKRIPSIGLPSPQVLGHKLNLLLMAKILRNANLAARLLLVFGFVNRLIFYFECGDAVCNNK